MLCLALGECPPGAAFPCPRGASLLSFFNSHAGRPQMRKGLCYVLQMLCGKGYVAYSGPHTFRIWADIILYVYTVENRSGEVGSYKGID